MINEDVYYENLREQYYDKEENQFELLYEQEKEKNEILQSIIDEAIEYIEKWQSFPHTNGSTHEELRNLKNILKENDK